MLKKNLWLLHLRVYILNFNMSNILDVVWSSFFSIADRKFYDVKGLREVLNCLQWEQVSPFLFQLVQILKTGGGNYLFYACWWMGITALVQASSCSLYLRFQELLPAAHFVVDKSTYITVSLSKLHKYRIFI